jgi:hypothetical protein
MKRREFLTSSLAASALAGLGTASLSASAAGLGSKKQEYYELRMYRLKTSSTADLLDQYLENVALPVWNKFGSKPVGVFKERDPKDAGSVWVLAPYGSLDALGKATAKLNAELPVATAASAYLQAPKDNPMFDRIDSWVLLAFAGMPRVELPSYCREKTARMFEIRIYQSHSEVKALKKVAMFNNGEIQVMRDTRLGPIFFGQSLLGPNLPHLIYMLSAENQDAHKQHWDAFGKHPVWNQMKNDPQYADTVSNIKNYSLVPSAYSQI